MASKPESNFRKIVDRFLLTLKNSVDFSIQQVSLRGIPDKLICCRGTFVGLELKAEDGKLSPLQEYNLHRIREAGGVALVARPSTWETAKAQLRKLDRGEVDD